MTAKRLAGIALGAMALFIGLVAALHGLKPEYDPSWRFLSEYSIGAHGWVMMLAFFAWAASCVALGMALRAEAVTRGVRIGRAVLLAVGLSLIVAGLFAQDPVTAKPEEMTTHGTIHAFASMVGIPGVPLAALLISRSVKRARPSGSRRRALETSAHLTWLSLVVMVVYLAVAVPRAGGFGPDVWAGWMNRLVVLTYCAWHIVASYDVYRAQNR